MQVQPATLGARLVAAYDTQPVALGQLRIVHIATILDAQHRGLRFHSLHRAQAVRRQDRLHGDL